VALAHDDERSLGAVVKFGVQRAQRAGSEVRAELLKVVRGMGAPAFADPAFARPLLHAAGTSEGGLLTPSDLARVPADIDQPAVPMSDQPDWFETAWAADGAGAASGAASVPMCVIAFDSRGVAAAVAYERCRDGIVIDAMELEAPRAAVPVLRGITRVGPGERLSAAANVAIHFEGGRALEVVAFPNVRRSATDPIAHAQLSIRRDPSSRLMTATRR
jgi:hypothetical protein